MPLPVRRLAARGLGVEELLEREWLVTNGLGGYAAGSLPFVPTRRFHGLLVAALPPPLGRTMMFNHLTESLHLPGGVTRHLGGHQLASGELTLDPVHHLAEVRQEGGLPVWRYALDGAVVEKRVLMPYRQNTVHLQYRLVEAAGPVRLTLRPAFHFRHHEGPLDGVDPAGYELVARAGRIEIHGPEAVPPLRLVLDGEHTAFIIQVETLTAIQYRVERARGYDHLGSLWCPGHFHAELPVGRPVTLVASVEPWDAIGALPPRGAVHAEEQRRTALVAAADPRCREGVAAELVLAADTFLFTPVSRPLAATRAAALGEQPRSIIAGYPWFTDWGRDTMISLEGLTLLTGRHDEARQILRTFASAERDGLIPNLFPEGQEDGVYHTADATLWFFHALGRYLHVTQDRSLVDSLLPQLVHIIERHHAGTRFGIRVDPADGLLTQGEEGYQLTWMDAKVDGWVVTPRRGKAVELNALYFNAVMLLSEWLAAAGDTGRSRWALELARRARSSFQERFWYAPGQHLYDVVDGPGGDDPALRPNQLLAISLAHPVLDPARWPRVLEAAERLLTPLGLRSLAPGHPDYRARYDGDLRSRDAAYHQGTVWAWLIGPYVDAFVRTFPGHSAELAERLAGLTHHLDDGCLGSVSEIFDAEAPYRPRGCFAQAWSVAELLRVLVHTAEFRSS